MGLPQERLVPSRLHTCAHHNNTSPLSIHTTTPHIHHNSKHTTTPLAQHYNTPVTGWPQFEAHPSITVTPRTLHRDPSLTIRTKTRCQIPVSTTQTSNQTMTFPPSWSRRKPRYRQWSLTRKHHHQTNHQRWSLPHLHQHFLHQGSSFHSYPII